MSSLVSIVVGLILAAVVYIVGTHLIPALPALLWGLVALLVFVAVAFGGVGSRFGRRY